MTQIKIKPGDQIAYNTPDSRRRGVAVAVGGGYVVGTFALIRTTRVDGEEIDAADRLSTTPLVVPVDAVEIIT